MSPESLQGESSPRILAVIVLFGQSAAESATLAALLRSHELAGTQGPDLYVLLYDNSPHASVEAAPQLDPSLVTYLAASGNVGLVGAYNEALALAERGGYPWLLTLDQDTELPADFLSQLGGAIREQGGNTGIAAIVPHLTEGSRPLSPARVRFASEEVLPLETAGVQSGEIRAYNSAGLLRVSAVRELGGFDRRFWLDHLDSWLYHALYRQGWRVYVLSRPVLRHQLSLLHYGTRMTHFRFRNFLQAESAFYDLYRGRLEGLAYTVRLLFRLRNQRRRGEIPAILAETRRLLRSRVSSKRSTRLRQWEQEMAARQTPAGSPAGREDD